MGTRLDGEQKGAENSAFTVGSTPGDPEVVVEGAEMERRGKTLKRVVVRSIGGRLQPIEWGWIARGSSLTSCRRLTQIPSDE